MRYFLNIYQEFFVFIVVDVKFCVILKLKTFFIGLKVLTAY